MEKIEIVGRFDEDDSPPPSSASSETSSKHGSRGATFEDGDLLHAAAFYSRVPAEEMTQQEEHAFPDVGHGPPELQKVFLLIRNRFLQLWLFSPKNELTLENAIAHLESPYNSEKVLAARIHAYLARYGFINFGIYARTTLKPKPEVRRPRVVVIGAGISGLTAASQLQQFGFEVVVLEGRDRVGGRIATFRKNNYIADLGASFVPGIGGNPLAVVVRQLDTQLVKMARKCPLYEAATGIPVAKNRDDAIEKEFKRLLEASAFLAHSLDIDRIDRNAPLSLGQAMEWLITLQEKRVKEQEVAYWKEYTSIQQRLMEIRDLLWEARKVAEQMKARVERTCSAISRQQKKAKKTAVVNDSFDSPRVEDVPLMMDAKIDIQVREERLRAWKRLDDEREQLELKLKKLIKNRPSEMYLSTADRQVLDWHLARLEYGNACRLDELSLKYWDHDEPYAFPGPHSAVINGFSTVPVALAEGLEIRLKQIVKKMSYSRDGVEVTTMKGETFTGDAILCTLPLGVLKEAVRPEANKEEKDANVSGWKPEFSPPLPSWKEGAINRLGYGVINKVVLCFQRCFWDTAVNMFGHVASTTESRGELFLFFYVYKAPVLVGLVVGDAAGVMESVTDEIVIGRCLSVLRNIFGVAQVPNPTETVVTRWKSDPMARGSYSYIGVGSSGADYDVLAAPVSPSADAGTGPKFPRLFFAGEHTMRRYPSTVHGALLSGLREAGKIADIFLGSPYVQPK